MPTKNWKNVERRIARSFGTERTPLSGGASRHTLSDTLHKAYYIEIKHRARIPFMATYKEAVTNAKKEGKTPMVIFHQKHCHDPIVMISLKDFMEVTHED